ncbi:MAG: hypothetical protein ACYC7D_16065, partial [Nitrososphaerales archaeon]
MMFYQGYNIWGFRLNQLEMQESALLHEYDVLMPSSVHSDAFLLHRCNEGIIDGHLERHLFSHV